jgi:hypothetical protein
LTAKLIRWKPLRSLNRSGHSPAEFFVLLPEYVSLFSQEERAEARRRLELYEFDVDHHLAERAMDAEDAPAGFLAEAEPQAAASMGVESPIVRAVVPPGVENTIWPTAADLDRARAVFSAHEPRDVFYRAAADLVALTLRGQSSIRLSEALAVLLRGMT